MAGWPAGTAALGETTRIIAVNRRKPTRDWLHEGIETGVDLQWAYRVRLQGDSHIDASVSYTLDPRFPDLGQDERNSHMLEPGLPRTDAAWDAKKARKLDQEKQK